MGKGTKTGKKNTFRFQSFSERIDQISIKLGRSAAEPQTADTHFFEALSHWAELNCTQQFVEFHRAVADKVQSHPQLLHCKDEIGDVLQQHLQVRDSLALHPVLDLLVQFTRDLQDDFMPYFTKFFDILVSLLNTHHHDPDVLEWIFTCLAKLFWFLRRFLIKDLQMVYKLCSPLLSSVHYREYINAFAAESLSYLLRKAKNKDEIFAFMFHELKNSDDQVLGAGRLLFEVIKMPHRQFFGCYKQVVPMLMNGLCDCIEPDLTVLNVLKQMIRLMAVHLTSVSKIENSFSEQSLFVIDSLTTKLTDLHKHWLEKKLSEPDAICSDPRFSYVLQLLSIWIEQSNGVLIVEPEKLANVMVQLMNGHVLPSSGRESILSVISRLLLSRNCKLETCMRSKLVSTVYMCGFSPEEVFSFTQQLLDIMLFESDVLPSLLNYCHQLMTGTDAAGGDILVMLVTLLLNKAAPRSGTVDCKTWFQHYALDFRSSISKNLLPGKAFPAWLLDNLSQRKSLRSADSTTLSTLWMMLFCLPHVVPMEKQRAICLLTELLKDLHELLVTTRDNVQVNMLLCIAEETVTALGLMVGTSDLHTYVPARLLCDVLNSYADCIPVLRMTDMVLSCAACDNVNDVWLSELFDDVFSRLKCNLSSPVSVVRLLTLHILCQFRLPLPPVNDDVEVDQPGVFQICFNAESTDLTVSTYRERIRHYEKLNHEYIHYQLYVGMNAQVPLQFLIGQLFVNFRPLWQPLRSLIKTYACGVSLQQFWDIFGAELQSVTEHIQNSKSVDDQNCTTGDKRNAMFFRAQQMKNGHLSNPDYINMRQQLILAMQEFPSVCEPRSRLLVPLFLRFVESEYFPSDVNFAPKQDLRPVENINQLQNNEITDANEVSMTNVNDGVVSLDDAAGEDGVNIENTVLSNDNASMRSMEKVNARLMKETLVLLLGLFAKFHDPKSLHRHHELRALYLDMLKSKSAKIQLEAFRSLLTYKHSYLVAYKEHLESLIDERSFRNELVLFSIDDTNSVIEDEHRTDLMPVLMRILFGKMKQGRDVSRRRHGEAVKTSILAFVAGCQQDEIRLFFDLIFEPFRLYLTDLQNVDGVEMNVQTIMINTDVAEVIPLRRLNNLLSIIRLILQKCGALVGAYLSYLFHMLVYVAGYSSALLQKRADISSRHVASLKSVRQLAQSQIVQFFSTFDKYLFSESEIEAVFLAVVWPQLEKLPMEGIYSPTPLLKLFNCWSGNKTYHHLLAKSSQSSVTPLSSTLELLVSPRCSASVTELVLSIVDKLLESDEEETDGHHVAVEGGDKSLTVTPVGVTLLMPHLPLVLEYLHRVVANLSSSASFSKHSKNKTLPTQELHVLSQLSQHVDSREQCTEMVSLLLPFLDGRFWRRNELEVDILTSVRNLICRCLQPEQFVPALAKQLSGLSSNQARKVLCEVFFAVADLEPSLKSVAVISSKLNSYDPRFVEEPDVEQRMEGFNEAKDLLKGGLLDTSFLLALVHNCCFVLASSDGLSDFAMRDQSFECLQILVENVARKINNDHSCDLFRVIIVQHLLAQVKSKLKLKSETARHAFIGVLENLVKHFPTSFHFADLVALQDASDVEVDFFRNIVHMQLHRRMKALRRLSRCISESVMKTETLVNYILPIITSMLRDPTFVKNSDRVDVAVETLGTVCRRLPWPRYLIVLRHYLGETLKSIENQKLVVKILVSVLDSFHFDLRCSSFTAATPYYSNPSTATNGDSEELQNEYDEALDGVEDKTMEVSETSASNSGGEKSSCNVCSAALATRIHRTIVLTVLPQLHKCLTKEAKAEGEHKLATGGKYAEDEEILRVPLALAMVKLLQQLPGDTVDRNLPGILLKVCRFLASRAKDIRVAARDTLAKIIKSLGPAYFGYIVTEMRSALKRGYQQHVLCYSLWDILKSIMPQLHPGDLDSSIGTLTEIFNEELFGEISEEKEVEGIISKLFEARTTKSLDSYGILANVVSKHTLPKLILPLKAELMKTHSSKTTKKIASVLKLIASGLVSNGSIEINYVLTYVYELMQESAGGSDGAGAADEKNKTFASRRPPDALLLKPQLPRTGSKAKTHSGTNLYVLAEFGLWVLYLLIKRLGLVSSKSHLHSALLDPFVSILNDCLASKHVKVTSSALRCLLTFLRLPLPSLKNHVGSIAGHVFVLLNNYAGVGAGKGDNFELVVMCFKVLTVLIRDVTFHSITEKQLHVLLVFVKQDLNDFTRQAVAFSILKAIISRKLVDPELEGIVREVRQMSIVSDAANVRQQCRQIAWQFMLDYPLADKKLDNQYLEFYVQQLNFEHESGRVSALEMLSTVFSTFPLGVLVRNSNLFFPALASRLINDDSSICRQMAAAAVKLLLTKLDEQRKDNLFDMSVKWLSNSAKPAVHRMSAKVIGLFVEVMSVKFRRHLVTILPLLKTRLSLGNDKDDIQLDSEKRQNDLMLFDFLSLLLKIVRNCSEEELNVMWCGQPWSDVLCEVWNSVEVHLRHPHSWVQLVSVQLFNEMFTACPPEHTIALYVQNCMSPNPRNKHSLPSKASSRSSEYLTMDLQRKLHVLSGSFCSQLSSAEISEQMANEVICSLLHVARMIHHLPVTTADDNDEKGEERASLLWLLRRLTREIRKESSGVDKSTIKKKAAYRWLHGLAKILGPDDILTHLKPMLQPLVREMTSRSPNVDADVKLICQETLEGIKDVAGSDAFSHEYATIQQAVGLQRQQRKTARHAQVCSVFSCCKYHGSFLLLLITICILQILLSVFVQLADFSAFRQI